MLASSVFFYGSGDGQKGTGGPADLFEAHDLISNLVGKRTSGSVHCHKEYETNK